MKEKILWGIAVVALVLSGLAFLGSVQGARIASNFGAAGNLLAENYIPYVLYNGGYNSAKDLTLSGSGNTLKVTTGAAATSTVETGRIQTYATSSATKICLDFNTQATTTNAGTANGVVTWLYGDCN